MRDWRPLGLLAAALLLTGCGSEPITFEPLSPPRAGERVESPAGAAAPGARSDPPNGRAVPGSFEVPTRIAGVSGSTGSNAASGAAASIGAGAAGANGAGNPESPSGEVGERSAATLSVVEAWKFGDADGRLHVSDHFRIHSTLADGSLDRALSTFAERALNHYRTALGALPSPDEPLETFIFGSRGQWERFTRQRLGSNAGPYLSMGKGGFTTEGDAILYDIGRLDTLTILAHEGWHQYTQRTFRHPLPLWLEEGIACWMEAVRPGRGESSRSPFLPWRNYERFSELRNGVRTDMLIPLEALLDSTPEQFLKQGKDRLLLYYAQVWALVHFLNEGENGRYAPQFRQLVSDAAEGRLGGRMANSQVFPNPKARSMHIRSRVGKWVLLEYFNPRFAEFKEEYERFIRQVTQPPASQRVWRGESPVATNTESSAP